MLAMEAMKSTNGKGNDALISKKEIDTPTSTEATEGEETPATVATDAGHPNEVVSKSPDEIKIENEINAAISEINAATGSVENIETTKLLNNEKQVQEVVVIVNETKKSTVKLNTDIEKQPLNHE